MKKSKKKRSKHPQKGKGRSVKKGTNEKACIEKGIDFFKSGNYHAALIEWQKVAFTDPKWQKILAEAHFRRGLEYYCEIHLKSEIKYNQILSEMTQAVKLQPDNGLYHFHLGLAYEHQGNLKKATSCYQKALEIKEEQRYLFQLVLVYIKRDMLLEAKQHAEFISDETKRFMLNLMFESIQADQEREYLLASGIPSKSGEYFLIQAVKALQKNESSEALSFFKKSAKSGSKDNLFQAINSYFEGMAFLQQENREAANEKFIRAFDLGLRGEYFKTNLLPALWEKGLKYSKEQNLSAALRIFEAIRGLAPEIEAIQHNINLIRFHRANELAHQEKYEEAVKLWQACKLKDDMNLFHNIAVAYDRLEHSKGANIHWRELINYWKRQYSLHPEQTRLKEHLIITHKRLGERYLKNDELSRAAKEFGEVLRYTPDDVETQFKLGEIYLDMEKWRYAQRSFESILKLQPENIDAMLNLAFIHEMDYETETALNILNRVLALDPDNREAFKQMQEIYHDEAHYYWDEEDLETAIEFFEKEIKLAPDRFNGYNCLADLYDIEFGDHKKIEILFNRYIKSKPQDPFAYLDIGAYYLSNDYPRKAQSFFSKAEAMSEPNTNLLFAIGKVYVENGNFKKGSSYFSKAVRINSKDFDLLFSIGYCLAPYYPIKAITYLQKSLKLQPDNVEVYMFLSMLYAYSGKELAAQKAGLKAQQLAKEQGKKALLDEFEKSKQPSFEQLDLF